MTEEAASDRADQAIVVTGGTGTLGRPVVARIRAAGRTVRVISRSAAPAGSDARDWVTADLNGAQPLEPALDGSSVLVHCATGYRRRADVAIAARVLAAARAVGIRHVVFISIVGVDCVPFGYYEGKRDVELLVAGSGIDYSILRATQFHERLVRLFSCAARSPLMPVPDFRFQPVAVAEVAEELAHIALGTPSGIAPELDGPQILDGPDLARAYLTTVRRRRAILPVRLPGKGFAGFRAGGNLTPERAVGRITFDQHLSTLATTKTAGE